MPAIRSITRTGPAFKPADTAALFAEAERRIRLSCCCSDASTRASRIGKLSAPNPEAALEMIREATRNACSNTAPVIGRWLARQR